MNWRISALDRYTLVSNSDAHSPQKLAREATVFDTELAYPAIFEALKSGDAEVFLGTIEFFPEEGKYHHDGHRKCNVNWDPKVTIAHNGLCPECGKPVTVGVLHRVERLADRPEGTKPAGARPYEYLVPLTEVIGAAVGVGPNSKRVVEAAAHIATAASAKNRRGFQIAAPTMSPDSSASIIRVEPQVGHGSPVHSRKRQVGRGSPRRNQIAARSAPIASAPPM